MTTKELLQTCWLGSFSDRVLDELRRNSSGIESLNEFLAGSVPGLVEEMFVQP